MEDGTTATPGSLATRRDREAVPVVRDGETPRSRMLTDLVVAHDYLTQRGGAERVALALAQGLQAREVVTAAYVPEQTFDGFDAFDITTSTRQFVRMLRSDPRQALPFLASAWSHMPTVDADAVVCSSSGWAHALPCTPRTLKVVYCHNPARWLYQRSEYMRDAGIAARAAIAALAPGLQKWDRRAAHSADVYVANSTIVAARIRRTYGIDARVVHPPVSLDSTAVQEPVSGLEPGYFMTVERGRGYKGTMTLVAAFAGMPDRRLVVVGRRMEVPLPGNVSCVGSVPEAQLRWLYAHARALVSVSHEDFGLTPVEANAFGTPSLVLRAGGFLDSTREGVSGGFIQSATADSVRAAVEAFPDDWDVDAIRAHARQFSRASFNESMRQVIADAAGARAPSSTVLHGETLPTSPAATAAIAEEPEQAVSDERFTVRVLDTVVDVVLDAALPVSLRRAIQDQWSHVRVEGATPQRTVVVCPSHVNPVYEATADVVQVVVHDLREAPDQLAGALTRIGLQGLVGDALMFHAAGMATRDGRVIAFVGPSGRGKTTACQALGATLQYVTDETVALRSDLTVIPYPKPLSIGTRPGVKVLYTPGEAGMRVADGPLRLAAFVLLDRRSEPMLPHVEAVPLADALGDLVGQTSSLVRLPAALHVLADAVAATGGVRRVVYSDAEDLPGVIADIFTAATDTCDYADAQASTCSVRQTVGATPLPAAARESDTSADQAPVADGTLTRAPYDDALRVGERTAVLTRRRLHVLDGIGPTVWADADGLTVEQLRAHVRASVGEPPEGIDADAAVDAAVEELTDEGLLRAVS